MDEQTSHKLIDKTRDDYNLIAEQFSSTRKFNWGDLAVAIRDLNIKKGAKVLDLGCGNGRIYDLMKDLDVNYYGLDISKELINFAKKLNPKAHFAIGNLLNTPYKDNEFDFVISVATLHHIPSKNQRISALKEIYRITKPKGKILLTAWYFWNKPQYLKEIVRSGLGKLTHKSELDFGDFYMTWKVGSGEIITKRYFHAWTKAEFKKLLNKVGFQYIKVGFFFKRNRKIGYNLIVTAKKP